ncbi:MAG: VWA domain-containing protein [Acidobacteria bacterium]|nr:VWA domain-containing protein [Acidobacteriota bacterium]
MTSTSFLANKSLFKNVCAALAFVLCAFGTATAQKQEPDDTVERIESNLVQLNIGVADRKGYAVTNLSRGDFVVYEDGVRQTIQSFEPASSPFSLVLLLDMSGSTLNFRQTLKQSAARFVDALAPDDRVAVISFWTQIKKGKREERVQTLTAFTTDRRKIGDGIASADGTGETNLYKALRVAIAQLSREDKRRKAIVVMTDGKDTGLEKLDRGASANAQTAEEARASVKPDDNQTLRGVLDAADRQGVTIYPLALPSGDIARIAQPLPQQVAIYTSARVRLQTLANRTGGRLHEINRLEDMGRLYAEVAADLRTLYTIAYQPPGTRPRDGSWRAINIEVSRADLIAHTRPGYYAR